MGVPPCVCGHPADEHIQDPDDPEEGWVTSAATVTVVLSIDGGGTWLDD
jgi:hypothetical protein